MYWTGGWGWRVRVMQLIKIERGVDRAGEAEAHVGTWSWE
jgi:hypothetical protein